MRSWPDQLTQTSVCSLKSAMHPKEIVREALTSTTAHAIGRAATSDRDPPVRLFWLIAFLCFLGLLISSSITYIKKLNNPGVKSVYKAEEVNFEFPDVYFCNTLEASGSFVNLLNKSEADQVNIPMGVAYEAFTTALRSMNATEIETAILNRLIPQILIQSVPYKSLADIVGQRKRQTFYRNYGIFSVGSEPSQNAPVKIDVLYHPNHLKCFKVALTDSELLRMRNTNSRLQFNLHLDPYFLTFKTVFNLYATENERLLKNMVLTYGGHNYFIFPSDWNLKSIEVDRGSGMLMYLTPRGQYPSPLTTQVHSLEPGWAYDIAIRMKDSLLTPKDFANQCVDQQDPVSFFNPYSGAADEFSYSEAFCYYTEIAKDMQLRYNCSPTPQPTPWQFRHLNLCLNLTAALGDNKTIHQGMRAAVAAHLSNYTSSAWYDSCHTKRLCKRRTYSVASSYGMWPNEASLVRLVENIMNSLLAAGDPNEFRSINIGVKTLEISRNLTFSTIGYEEGVRQYFRQCCLKVTLRAEAARSSLTVFSLDYGLPQFVSDMGGALGLYLGASLLTLLEFVELIHCLLSYACDRQKVEVND